MSMELAFKAALDVVLIVIFNVFLVKTVKVTKRCVKQGCALRYDWLELGLNFVIAVAVGVGAFAMYWTDLRPFIRILTN